MSGPHSALARDGGMASKPRRMNGEALVELIASLPFRLRRRHLARYVPIRRSFVPPSGGANAGGAFWGCVAYPACLGTRQAD